MASVGAKLWRARQQRRAAAGLVALVSDRDTADLVARVAFGDRAAVVALDGATALVPNTGDGDAADLEMRGGYADDLATRGSAATSSAAIRQPSGWTVRN